MNSESYCECLKDALLPAFYTKPGEDDWLALDKKEEYILMQDGARPHMSDYSYEWLLKKLPKKINFTDKTEWPPRSPDLNPIENLWAILQDKVVERQPQNQAELCEVLQEEWWAIDQSTIQKLFDGMEERIRRCNSVEGGRFSLRDLRKET